MKTGIITPLKDSGLSWEEFRVPIVIGEVVLDLGNYVLVRSELLNEIKSLWAKIEELEDKERRERIRRLIREYQESRRKTE
jgi:predicted RNase H-like nuclease (RuvC/YqgF family)